MELRATPSTGMTVEVTVNVERVPSRKFDFHPETFDFDYTLERGGATRSVSLDNERVCQLHYHAGGDADWSAYELVDIEVVG